MYKLNVGYLGCNPLGNKKAIKDDIESATLVHGCRSQFGCT